MASRGSGKSVFGAMAAQLAQPRITLLDQAQVDEDRWYTVDVDPDVASWIRQQSKEHWYEHSGRTFRSLMDVHEHLYTLIRLKF